MMSNLPTEVLINVFSQLTQLDLRQCQLTSKKWYMTATKALYSNVEIIDDDVCRKYINRIKKSPELGKYLKSLDAKNQFFGHHQYLKRLNKFRLLSTVSNYCPNITSIIARSPDRSFWSQLYQAVKQGQIKNVQYLPNPSYASRDTYPEITLLLRKSLKEMTLFNYGEPNTLTVQSSAYQRVQPFVGDFLKLENFKIDSNSQIQKLTHLDTIIQDFRHINSLIIVNSNHQHSRLVQESVILNVSSCNIRSLECNWELINSDNQLMYVMQMFPKLYYLKTIYFPNFNRLSSISTGVLVQFLHYVSKISKFQVQYIMQENISGDSLIKFMNSNFRNKEMNLRCHPAGRNNRDTHYIEFTNDRVTIIFSDYHQDSQYIDTLYEAANFIRLLQINIADVTRTWDEAKSQLYGKFQNVHLILQSCPSLEILKFKCNKPAFKTQTQDIDFMHLKLNSLSICAMGVEGQLDFVKRAGLNLPNLKHIHLEEILASHNIALTRYIFIDVPYTSLELLEWTGYSRRDISDDKLWCCFINLNINSTKKIFIANGKGLFIINDDEYLSSRLERPDHQVHFMITCQYLNQFKVSFYHSLGKLNWCFENF